MKLFITAGAWCVVHCVVEAEVESRTFRVKRM